MISANIYKAVDEEWIKCGEGLIDEGETVDCEADLGEEVYRALDAVVKAEPGEYFATVDGVEYRVDVGLEEPHTDWRYTALWLTLWALTLVLVAWVILS